MEFIPQSGNIGVFFTSVINFIEPYCEMWPFFYFKMAGVHLSDRWLLRYLSVEGRFDDNARDDDTDTPSEKLIFAKSGLFFREESWPMLQRLRDSGTIRIKDIDAYAPMELLMHPGWETLKPNTSTDDATWSCLSAYWAQNDHSINDLHNQLQREANTFGEPNFERFTEKRIGEQCHLYELRCRVEFPLGLKVRREGTKLSENKAELDVRWRKPLSLESLHVNSGTVFETSDSLQINNDVQSSEAWSCGKIFPMLNCGYVWFSGPHLDMPLKYDLPLQTTCDQATIALRTLYSKVDLAEREKHSYNQGDLKQGENHWIDDLMKKDGGPFEIALLNTIARFGYGVLFGGGIKDSSSNSVVGPATPNYDLIVLDHPRRRALLISLKGSAKGNFPNNQDANKLQRSKSALGELMHGWHLYGLLACQAERKEGEGSPVTNRADLRILWKEDLIMLFEANHRTQIETVLWEPPKAERPSPIHQLWGEYST